MSETVNVLCSDSVCQELSERYLQLQQLALTLSFKDDVWPKRWSPIQECLDRGVERLTQADLQFMLDESARLLDDFEGRVSFRANEGTKRLLQALFPTSPRAKKGRIRYAPSDQHSRPIR